MTSFETTTSAEKHAPISTASSRSELYGIYAPASNPARYDTGAYERSAAIRSMIQHGQIPLLDNGWAFAMDRRPAGKEKKHIPATEFTRRYFRHGLVPFAAPDHSLHDHDLVHMPIYQWMFSVPRFATLARTAATNASATKTLCKEFTGAMDDFGDCLGVMWLDRSSNGGVFIGDLRDARNDLTHLITLEAGSSNLEATQEAGLIDELWYELGLTAYENEVMDVIPGLRYYPDDRSNIAQQDTSATESYQKRNALISKVGPVLLGLTHLPH